VDENAAAAALAAVGLLSGAASVAGMLALPALVGRLPADALSRPPVPWVERVRARPWTALGRNLLGVSLIGLGLALLVLPGQGVLTLLLGLGLTDLPGRDAAVRGLARRAPVARALQALRRRAGAPPLRGIPGGSTAEGVEALAGLREGGPQPGGHHALDDGPEHR